MDRGNTNQLIGTQQCQKLMLNKTGVLFEPPICFSFEMPHSNWETFYLNRKEQAKNSH
jgi:hypothetical protein